MRSRYSRHIRHLAALFILLGTYGGLLGTTGGALSTSTACGCEAEERVEATDKGEESTDTKWRITNTKGVKFRIISLVKPINTGHILPPSEKECQTGTELEPGASCEFTQDDPVASPTYATVTLL
jgi:hypothetical protein